MWGSVCLVIVSFAVFNRFSVRQNIESLEKNRIRKYMVSLNSNNLNLFARIEMNLSFPENIESF